MYKKRENLSGKIWEIKKGREGKVGREQGEAAEEKGDKF